MKSTLSILMITLVAGYTLAIVGALAGVLPAAAFLGSEAACFIYAFAGLTWISLNDAGRRPTFGHLA